MDERAQSARPSVDLSRYRNEWGWGNRLGRVAWGVVWALLFRFTPPPCFGWRRLLLRLFGARIGRGAHVYPSCRVWAPWNLEIGAHGCLGPRVDCYCVAPVSVGAHATVSQYVHLCAATHDIADARLRLVTQPIRIGAGAWVCAGAFVGPGVTIGEGAVAGARAVVVSDVDPWTVVAGNPARFIKRRELASAPSP